jgi:hypothetical protein
LRLLLVLVPTQSHGGEALEQGQPALFRMISLRQFTAPRPEHLLSESWKVFNAWHPQSPRRRL